MKQAKSGQEPVENWTETGQETALNSHEQA
jgi:hypothetical protein